MTCPRCAGWVYPSPEADGQVDLVCLACGYRAPPTDPLPLIRDKPELAGHRGGGLTTGGKKRLRGRIVDRRA